MQFPLHQWSHSQLPWHSLKIRPSTHCSFLSHESLNFEMGNEERVPTLNYIANHPHNIESQLEQEKHAAFQTFKQRCLEDGLLDIPSGLSKSDVGDGITDDCTLL